MDINIQMDEKNLKNEKLIDVHGIDMSARSIRRRLIEYNLYRRNHDESHC